MAGPRSLENIRSAIAAQQPLRFKPRGNYREVPFGVPVALSSALVVVQSLRDFFPDGYHAIPLRRIGGAKAREPDKVYGDVCRRLGITATFATPPGIEIDSLIAVLGVLRKRNEYVVVEAEVSDEQGEGTLFLIGLLKGLSDSGLAVLNFDACGMWDEQPTTVRFEDVLNVQWGSLYIQTWQRYLQLPSKT